jgi:hypothetical protein
MTFHFSGEVQKFSEKVRTSISKSDHGLDGISKVHTVYLLTEDTAWCIHGRGDGRLVPAG